MTQKLSLFALLLSAAAFAAETPQYVTKEAEGEAAIINNDVPLAEKNAIEAAKRAAVEEVAGTLLSADTLVQNNVLISDRIYAKTAGYIRKVDVLSKSTDKGVVKVKIKAEVGAAQIDKDLEAVKAMISRLGSRRMVILTQEQSIDNKGITTSSSVLATELTTTFKKDGWTLIDPNFAAGKMKLSSGVAMGAADAKEIGNLTKADYILYGNVNFRYQVVDGPMKSALEGQFFPVTGEYELTLFATDSGSQLAKISGKFDMKGITNAMDSYERSAHEIAKKRGPSIVAEVRNPVLENLRDSEMNGNRVVMSVSGLNDYASVQGFKKQLSSISKVKDVKPGTFGNGKAEFDVTYVGTTDDLAEAIGKNSTLKKKKVSVTGVTANTLELMVAK
jgi:hypothetical protein